MRLLTWILSGAVMAGIVAPTHAQYRYRPYRRTPYPYSSTWQQGYAPQTYNYPPLGYPDPDSAPPAPNPGDGRHMWIYGSQGEGSFRQLPNGNWVESNSTGQYNFREIRRTPTYIDLFDPSRNAFARLTDGMMYSHGLGDPVWHPGYRGTWQQ
jgi:hypothetical protein